MARVNRAFARDSGVELNDSSTGGATNSCEFWWSLPVPHRSCA